MNIPSNRSTAPNGRPLEIQPKWRQDFPIDVADDELGARREFTKFAVLVSFAFVVGQCWIALKSWLRRRKPTPGSQRIAAIDDVAVGAAMLFHYPTENDPCLLLRAATGTFFAYSNQCTHLMCAVRPEMDQSRLHCPCHAGYFDLATGRPIAGPPRRPLPRIVLEVRAGSLYAVGVERRTI
ncbi:MAG: Rieske 2Fe-2S domain-containing protein [Pirellulales bacterium]|nr:Rieske 2Fe-2S domain-containing protein [Pirellulales bacterium]